MNVFINLPKTNDLQKEFEIFFALKQPMDESNFFATPDWKIC